jgi:hypothetical protein
MTGAKGDKMSKKDYQAIARAIHEVRMLLAERETRGTVSGQVAVAEVQRLLAGTLASDNPRFDAARFAEACETGRCKGMRQ